MAISKIQWFRYPVSYPPRLGSRTPNYDNSPAILRCDKKQMRRDTRKSERSTLHHLSVAQQNFGCFQPRLLRYRSRFSRSAGYSINLPASTRLRRRSNGKPCIVCKTGRAPTAIVVPAQVLELGKGAGELSISFGSPHLKQKGIRRLCTTTWERRCRHVGS
jgi:hypothetical protein